MYYVKTKATGELARESIGPRGRTVKRREGVLVVAGSLVAAQRTARLMRVNGLLR